MSNWRARLIFLAVTAALVVSSVGGAIHWNAMRVITGPLGQ